MTTKAGDYVVLFRVDGTCDLFKIDEAGARVPIRVNCPSPQDARRVARGALQPGAQLWVCDEATPNVVDLY